MVHDAGMVLPCGDCGVQEFSHVWRLRKMWQAHGNDTSVSVHMNQVMARFWERASSDDQWICLPAQLAVGKALITSGQSEPGCEMMACFPVYSL